MLSTQPYKGARDFYPEEKRFQKYLFQVMRSVVEKYGYEEYDAPIIESLELYAAKSGEEIVNEQTYAFTDRGGREVTLRPEMTPSVSRMVAARRQELAYPLRWYSIPNVWRYERPQKGRLREHWQLNVDIFDGTGLEAEHEIIQIAEAIMHAFGAKRSMYVIKLNSRKFIDFILHEYFHLNEVQAHEIMKLIDRMHKVERALFVAQIDAMFSPTEREQGRVEEILSLLDAKEITELPKQLQAHPSLVQLEQLMKLLKADEITNIVFDITLMRGFDYYTDIVFEVNDTSPENNRSMFGGGRYDGLVGLFGVETVPTVGFGMGDVTMRDFLEAHNLMPKLHTETDAYIVLIGDIYESAQRIIQEFREMGLKVAVDMSGRKPAAQIKAAVKKGIPYAIFIGQDELNNNVYALKDLETGTEEKHSPQRIVTLVKDYRKK